MVFKVHASASERLMADRQLLSCSPA